LLFRAALENRFLGQTFTGASTMHDISFRDDVQQVELPKNTTANPEQKKTPGRMLSDDELEQVQGGGYTDDGKTLA
jgi:hypothetical protein